MFRAFCSCGNNEPIKCAVHASAAVVAAMCAAYNITAWCFRRDHHLRTNSIVYTLAVIWEMKQTLHHLEACQPRALVEPDEVETSVAA